MRLVEDQEIKLSKSFPVQVIIHPEVVISDNKPRLDSPIDCFIIRACFIKSVLTLESSDAKSFTTARS